MFTGVQFLSRFNAVYDTMMNGIIPPSKLNQQIAQAQTEYFAKMFKVYGLSSTINAELEPLISNVSLVPTNNVIPISSVPNYFIPISIVTTYSDGVNSYTKTAQPLAPNYMVGSYGAGSVVYPRYSVEGGNILLFPKDKNCTLCDITYFRELFVIDVTSTTPINYNDDTFMGILSQLLSVYGLSLGDNRYRAFENEERENSKTIIR